MPDLDEQFYELLAWHEGEFELEDEPEDDPKKLLAEARRLIAESAR